jgi:spore coat protein U-like protein
MRFQITASAVALFISLILGLCSNAHAVGSCGVAVLSGIGFGQYNPLVTDRVVNQTGVIEVSCKVISPPIGAPISYNVDISAGSSNSVINRTLRQGGDTLDYNVYRNVGATEVWGDATGGFRVSGGFSNFVALNSDQKTTHTVYAVISPRQLGKAVSTQGLSYSDTLLVTLSF